MKRITDGCFLSLSPSPSPKKPNLDFSRSVKSVSVEQVHFHLRNHLMHPLLRKTAQLITDYMPITLSWLVGLQKTGVFVNLIIHDPHNYFFQNKFSRGGMLVCKLRRSILIAVLEKRRRWNDAPVDFSPCSGTLQAWKNEEKRWTANVKEMNTYED